MVVPSAREIAAKFARVTPEREPDYEAGVRSPKADWETETAGAEENYEEGVRKAIARKGFGKGVREVGTAKQQAKSIEKGVEQGRWAAGVRGAEDDMAEGMEPVVRTLEAVKLPGKFPKGDPRNYERVKAIGVALHKMKTGE